MTFEALTGLTIESVMQDIVVLTGSLAACKRMADRHGLTVERLEGFRDPDDRNFPAARLPADPDNPCWIWFNEGGFILAGRPDEPDSHSLVIRREIWDGVRV